MLWQWVSRQKERLLELLNQHDKRLSVFIICFTLATFFWFLNALSKTYITTVEYPLVYENLPTGFVVVQAPEKNVLLEVESYGFNLLGTKISSSGNQINLTVDDFQFRNKGNGKIGYLTNKLLFDKITSLLNSEVKVNRVLSDSLYLYIEEEISQEKPIAFRGTIAFPKQYELSREPYFNPAFIKVSGPYTAITELDSLHMVASNFEVSELNYKTKVELEDEALVAIAQNEVELNIDSEQYTSFKVEVPVGIKNLPDSLQMRLFPPKAELHFSLPLRMVKENSENLVELYVDFREIEVGNPRLSVKSKLLNEQIRLLLNPIERVEYLIFK